MLNLDELMGSAPAEVVPVALVVTDETSQPVELADLFGSMPVPIVKAELPGVTAELVSEIYGAEIPENYTQTDFTIAALAYVMALIDRDGYCVLNNWPAWVYHSLPFISSTLLKSYATLPSTARTPFVPGDDANTGSGIHAFSLQGQAGLDAECHFGPKFGKSVSDIAARLRLEAEHSGKTVLPAFYGSPAPGQPIMDVICGVDKSLNDHPKVGPVLRDSQKEVSMVWVDEGTQCICKARADIIADRVIFDLKKCRSIAGFNWQIKDLHYDIQAGHYFNAAVACGLNPVAFGFIPIEAFPPYQVAWGYRNPEKLDMDCINAKRLIGLVKQSQLTGVWHNFPIPDHIYNLNDLTPDDTAQDY